MGRPYDNYVDKVLSDQLFSAPVNITFDGVEVGEYSTRISKDDLRSLLADAWMEGLKHSLVMMESVRRKRDGGV